VPPVSQASSGDVSPLSPLCAAFLGTPSRLATTTPRSDSSVVVLVMDQMSSLQVGCTTPPRLAATSYKPDCPHRSGDRVRLLLARQAFATSTLPRRSDRSAGTTRGWPRRFGADRDFCGDASAEPLLRRIAGSCPSHRRKVAAPRAVRLAAMRPRWRSVRLCGHLAARLARERV
jgi:transposase